MAKIKQKTNTQIRLRSHVLKNSLEFYLKNKAQQNKKCFRDLFGLYEKIL